MTYKNPYRTWFRTLSLENWMAYMWDAMGYPKLVADFIQEFHKEAWTNVKEWRFITVFYDAQIQLYTSVPTDGLGTLIYCQSGRWYKEERPVILMGNDVYMCAREGEKGLI